jgi:hypothetical protein
MYNLNLSRSRPPQLVKNSGQPVTIQYSNEYCNNVNVRPRKCMVVLIMNLWHVTLSKNKTQSITEIIFVYIFTPKKFAQTNTFIFSAVLETNLFCKSTVTKHCLVA